MSDVKSLFVFLLCLKTVIVSSDRVWLTPDNLENHVKNEDLQELIKIFSNDVQITNRVNNEDSSPEDPLGVPEVVDCFGLGALTRKLPFLLNMQPDTVDEVGTHFYFTSRKQRSRVQVYPGNQFQLDSVDFQPSRKTVMIVHGFMSHSNASWVNDMTRAFLEWDDVNVIAVDWSKGGNTWKYWRAVANTRRVGSDVYGFFQQLIAATGAKKNDFHFVGHSLGAHICSYVSYHLGRVHRITGLDPAQPCFRTENRVEYLDDSDADFVDVVHTNGRMLHKIGFGLPAPIGHADFYPNGGMVQPGCFADEGLLAKVLPTPIARLQQSICSHGRAYLLFTESLINNNCSFRGHSWNLTYEGVNASLRMVCDRRAPCTIMGIEAAGGNGYPRAKGPYFVLTTDKEPFCPTELEWRQPREDLLKDLQRGFQIDPRAEVKGSKHGRAECGHKNDVLTEKSWYQRWFGTALSYILPSKRC